MKNIIAPLPLVKITCLLIAVTISLCAGCQPQTSTDQKPKPSTQSEKKKLPPRQPLLKHEHKEKQPTQRAYKVGHHQEPSLQQSDARNLPLAKSMTLSRKDTAHRANLQRYVRRNKALRLLIETDKPLYTPGETIWIRAVLIYHRRNQLHTQQSEAEFRIIKPSGQLLGKQITPSYHGHSRWSVQIPRHTGGGSYKIKVKYPHEGIQASHKIIVATYQPPNIKKKLQYLRKGYGGGEEVQAILTLHNATGQPLKNKKVQVTARIGDDHRKLWFVNTDQKGMALLSYRLPKQLKAKEGSLSVKVSHRGSQESIARPIPLRQDTVKVGFFPEGGHAIIGHASRVYVAARQPNQEPQDIEGVIKDSQGKRVAHVQTFHDGMGRFVYTPQKSTRYALHITKPRGVTQTFLLPVARTEGVTFQHIDQEKSRDNAISLRVVTSISRMIVATALQHETLLGQQRFQLNAGAQRLRLPLKHRWRGIIRLTLSDIENRPLAERLVFRHHGKGLQFKVQTDRKQYQPRDTVQVKVKVMDPTGRPVPKAHVGAAVVDDTVIQFADDHEPQWLAQRFLTQQLTGKIHKPNFYFHKSDKRTIRALDLVMGTHGWRGLSWTKIKQSPPPKKRKTRSTRHFKPFAQVRWTRDVHINPRRHRASINAKQRARLRHYRSTSTKEKDASRFVGKNIPTHLRRLLNKSGMLPGIDLSIDGADHGGGRMKNSRGKSSKKRIYGRSAMNLIGNMYQHYRKGWLKKIEAKGPLSKAQIAQVIRQNDYQVSYCYESQLRASPRLSGTVIIRLVIAGGTAQAARKTSSTMNNQRVESCLIRRMLRWRFPQPSRNRAKRSTAYVQLKFDATHYHTPAHLLYFRTQRSFPTWFYQKNNRHRGKRWDFRQTIYWHPHHVTDAKGEFRFRFGLTDNITSFQLRLSGVGRGSLGQHRHLIPSTKSMYMTAKVPMEVSSGDELLLPVTVHNQSKKPLVLKLSHRIGHALKRLKNPTPGRIRLLPGRSHTSFYALKVKADRGPTTVSFLASGDGLQDQLTRTIQIKARGYIRKWLQVRALTPNKEEILRFHLPRSAFAVESVLGLPLSTAQRLDKSLQSILREPHGCLEQTSSVNEPNLLALQYLRLMKKASPAFIERAHRMIARGYRRLLGFQTGSGGFSMYGNRPPSEELTAYALLQLATIQQVHGGVDKTMLDRHRQWLLSRRAGRGGYIYSKSSNTPGNDAGRVSDAYITYALTALGERSPSFAREQQALLQSAIQSKDAYIIALALKMQTIAKGKRHPSTRQLIKILREQQQQDGHFTSKTTLFGSTGSNRQIETTGLALQALLGAEAIDTAIKKARRWLLHQQGHFGGFGTSQGTIQALRALLAYARLSREEMRGTIALHRGGKFALRGTIGSKGEAQEFPLNSTIRPGDNQLSLRYSGTQTPYAYIGVRYRMTRPLSSPLAPIWVTTKLQTTKVRMGEIVRLRADFRNRTNKTLRHAMLRIAIPGGLTTQGWQIKALKQQAGASLVETQAREVTLYFDTMAPAATKTIKLDLIARIPGNYTGGASSAYLYYGDEYRYWDEPLKISVVP